MDTVAVSYNVHLLRDTFSVALDKLRATRDAIFAQVQSKLVTLGLVLDSIHFSDPTQDFSKATQDAISRVLDDFEGLVLDVITSEGQPLKASNHPKLHVLQELLSRHQAVARYLDFGSLRYEDGLLDNLEQLNFELRRCDRHVSEPAPVAPPKADPRSGENVWHALYKHLPDLMTCPKPHDTHQMRLCLGTFEEHANALRFILTHSGPHEWHPVDFCPRSAADQYPDDQETVPTSCQLCDRHLQRSKIRAIKFCYDSDGIWPGPRGAKLDKWNPQFQTVQEWLKQDTDKSHRKALQCILSQWLGQACGTPWIPQTWDTRSIWLDEINTAKDYPLPYTEHQSDPAAVPTGIPDSASMMRFALLMLRIEFPKVDFSIDDEDELDEDDLDERLNDFLETSSVKNEMEARFKKVMAICHNWDPSKWDPSTSEDSQYILDQIYNPLKEELVWRFEREVPMVPERPPGQRLSVNRSMGGNSTMEVLLPQARPPVALYDDFLLDFDSRQVTYAEGFFERYRRFRTEHAIHKVEPQDRVKIAILDSGLDRHSVQPLIDAAQVRRSHQELAQAGMNVIADARVFARGDQRMRDNCGHGTRVLNLLLKTAPDACFYVAKISDTMHDNDPNVLDRILTALDWAIQQNVDLINMSFGFPEAPRDPRLHNKILEAHRKGIKMFAAAANHGRNGPRSYPASAREVICINAADGQGAWDHHINPSQTGQRDKWNTLGVSIQFEHEQAGPRSGTSYASPIAAGIVANVIDSVRYLERNDYLDKDVATSLQRLDGVEKIMGAMSPDGYLAPWLFWNQDSLKPEDLAANFRRINRGVV